MKFGTSSQNGQQMAVKTFFSDCNSSRVVLVKMCAIQAEWNEGVERVDDATDMLIDHAPNIRRKKHNK